MAETTAVDCGAAAEIRCAVLERRAVLFCGAGISVEAPATLPEWKTLRDETIKAVAGADAALVATLPTLLEQRVDGGIGQALAPELVATIVRAIVPDYFQSLRVLDHDQPNRNHTLITRLAKAGLLRYVLSTNFDQLIETAFHREGVELRVLRSDDDFAAFDLAAADSDRPVLFKLHGCISNPDTIVATVEQEAVGLSPQKAAVLRALWDAHTAVFWGYSGADLKLDVDYLKLLIAATTAKGFVWNLYATRDYREPPNEFVQQLVKALEGRARISHEALVDVLGPLVDFTPSPPPASDDALALKRQRSEALIGALAAWAKGSVSLAHAYEILARLHNSVGDLGRALECYQRLADLGHQQARFAIEALALARGAEILAHAGRWEQLGGVLERADDLARTAGALEIDLLCARIRAEAVKSGGLVLASIQPRAFARRLAPWTPEARLDALAVDLDTADHLANQRLFEPALALCQAVEDDARRAGRLVQVAEALARRSRVHQMQRDIAAALPCLREATRLNTVLGLRAEARLLQLRTALLELATGVGTDTEDMNRAIAELAPLADQSRNERLACETLLLLLESTDVDLQKGLTLIERIRQYVVEGGGQHLALRLAVQQSRFLSAADRIGEERKVIEDVLPELARVGNETVAESLLSRLAQIEQAAGRVLGLVQQAVSITRRTNGFAIPSEQALARLRVNAGVMPALPSVSAFLQTWQTHFPDLPHLLPRFTNAAGGLKVADLARSLEEQLGTATALAWLVWRTASLCRQFRLAGESTVALALAAGTQPMSLVFGDHQLSAILYNECGLNLLVLKHPQRALEAFTQAIHEATTAGDLAELVDDHVNAADACEALGRLDAAVEHLGQARQYVEVRQDLETATDVALRRGELFKKLERDQDAIEEFQTAEYFTRTLCRAGKVEQVVARLGKLYWNLGEFEASIRYREELVATYKANGQPGVAATFALLVANTYDEKLNRPADAALAYERALALNGQGGRLDASELQSRLSRCQARPCDTRDGLWDALLAHSASPESAAQTAARLAMAVDYNLWRFEPRSFGAWYERVFGGQVPYPAPGDPELPIWPFAAVYQIVELARSARDLHRHEDSLRLSGAGERLARVFGIAQGECLAAQASAITCAELGRADLATAHRARAQTIKSNFDAAAKARGIKTLEAGDRVLEPWNQIGFLLALNFAKIPDVSTRHTMVKGRLTDEFFLNPATRVPRASG